MPEPDRITSLRAATGASAVWDWDFPTQTLYADDGFAEIYGLDAKAAQNGLPAEVFFQAIHPGDRARIRIAIAGIMAGAEFLSKEFRLVTPDNATIWVHARGRGHCDDHDRPVRFTGVLVDVTERKRAEERLRIAQSAGGIGTFEYIDGYATVTVSEEFCRLLGLHPALSLPVQTINSVVQPGQMQLLPDTLPGNLPDDFDATFRITRNDDHALRWIARRGEILREGKGYRLIGVIYDVTESQQQEAALRELNDTLESRVQSELAIRNRAVEALRQTQKMESIGQLTGGIAHDFNNLLMAISSSLELLRKRIPDDPQSHRLIENARAAATRGAALTQRMLAFARQQDLKPEPVDIVRLVGNMTQLLQHTLGPAWTLEFDLPDEFPPVVADSNQLEMAIVNLAVNARDAMVDGGTIRIAANRVQVAEGDAIGLVAGDYLKLSVVDHGVGMDAATLQRATEPFFTTKGVGKGTGLGLSMIDGLANQLQGTFTIESTPGVGTTAMLWLPIAEHGTPAPAADPRNQVADLTARPLRIVAVDDDALILMNTADFLTDLGHEVFEAASGQAALDLLAHHPDIDLLVTDQAMPNMTGLQLVEKARAILPDLPVVVATGYGDILQSGKACVTKLAKPFTQHDLEQALIDAVMVRAP
jgi:PAS domain S-box-containing protein